VVVRLLLWSLADSLTSIEEVRSRLPEPIAGVTWLSDEGTERFGVLICGEPGEDLSVTLVELRELIGKDPEVGEDFQAEPA
jgi:hypothetical protein